MWVPFIPLLPFNPESCENGGFVWPLTLSGQTPQYLSQAPEASLSGSAASTPFALPSTCNSIPSQHSGIARGEAILTLKVKQYHPKGQSAVGPREAFDDLAGPNELFMQRGGRARRVHSGHSCTRLGDTSLTLSEGDSSAIPF